MTTAPELSALCQSCALCCDGTLFQLVKLEPEELPRAADLGLRLLADHHAFAQPCRCLAGGSCGIYTQRPRACRTFRCRLYASDRSLELSLRIVERTRELLARADLCTSQRAELEGLLDEHFARASGSAVAPQG